MFTDDAGNIESMPPRKVTIWKYKREHLVTGDDGASVYKHMLTLRILSPHGRDTTRTMTIYRAFDLTDEDIEEVLFRYHEKLESDGWEERANQRDLTAFSDILKRLQS